MSNEKLLQRVTSEFHDVKFLQPATSTTRSERILQRLTSDFTTNNEQRVMFNE